MANPFPFTAGQVLTAAQMNGIGEYTAYTPTFVNLTVGNGTIEFRFGRVQNFIHVLGKITFGSTTAITGSITVTYPVTAAANITGQQIGLARLVDSGAGVVFGIVNGNNTTTASLSSYQPSGSLLLGASFSSTSPFTWANTDIIFANFVYEAA
jgi:hypothetical protein